jgi:hypothetical protein
VLPIDGCERVKADLSAAGRILWTSLAYDHFRCE